MGQSSNSSDPDHGNAGAAAMTGALAGSSGYAYAQSGDNPYRLDGITAGTRTDAGSYFERTPSPEMNRDSTEAAQPTEVQEEQQQQQSFLGERPAEQDSSALSAEQGISYSEWMAPAAAGVGVAGMAAAAHDSEDQKQGEIVKTPEEEKPVVPEKSSRRSSPPDSVAFAGGAATSETKEEVAAPAVDTVPVEAAAAAPVSTTTANEAITTNLGGLEREGAHETGAIFPKVIRHNTDMSISNLHVPGKFPKQL